MHQNIFQTNTIGDYSNNSFFNQRHLMSNDISMKFPFTSQHNFLGNDDSQLLLYSKINNENDLYLDINKSQNQQNLSQFNQNNNQNLDKNQVNENTNYQHSFPQFSMNSQKKGFYMINNIDEEPRFVNEKQYNRMMIMRVKKAKRVALQSNIKENRQNQDNQKLYKYESRHQHAIKRIREPNGRFQKILNKVDKPKQQTQKKSSINQDKQIIRKIIKKEQDEEKIKKQISLKKK